MLVFVYRSVKYANRADVKLSVHRLFTFFCHLAHDFYLRAYVLFTFYVLLLLNWRKSSCLVSYFQTSLTIISQLLLILAQMKRNIAIVLIFINMRARGSKWIISTPKGPKDSEESKRKKMYAVEMLDLMLLLDIGFPSHVARALYTS